MSNSWQWLSCPVGPRGVLESSGTGKGLEKTQGEPGTMGQSETMLVLRGSSSMLLLCIDGAAILLLLPKVVVPRILETPGSMCSLPCTLQREKRHVPTRTRLWAVHHYIGFCLSVLWIWSPLSDCCKLWEPSLPEFTMGEHPGWCKHVRWLEVGLAILVMAL